MSYKNQTTVNVSWSGLCCFLTFLLFLGLKLGGVINWSWWWITAPLWGPVVLTVALIIVIATVYFFIGIIKAIKARNAIK